MLTFGIIAEGMTDHAVLRNVLVGYFGDQEEPRVVPLQPVEQFPETPGGWPNVLKSLQLKRHEEFLQFPGYLVIHIDTDVQEEPAFDVPIREAGKELSPIERIERVTRRINREIDLEFLADHRDRILYAVALESIECWLLPLLYTDGRASKVTGCEEAVNRALRKKDKLGLSANGEKFVRSYEIASRDYLKQKTLLKHRDKNPSLDHFLSQLDELRGRLPDALGGVVTE